MAKGKNLVIIIGHLGRDPEMRYTQSGNAVCNLNVAVTERRKDGDGWVEKTEWMRVVCFGRTAENAGQYLAKGRQVYVEGRLQTRSYKDKEGSEKFVTEVVANEILFLAGGPSDRDVEQAKASGGAPDNVPDFYSDDLPF